MNKIELKVTRSASAGVRRAHEPRLPLNKILRQNLGVRVSQYVTPLSDVDANEISANTNRILILYHFNSYKTRPITGSTAPQPISVSSRGG